MASTLPPFLVCFVHAVAAASHLKTFFKRSRESGDCCTFLCQLPFSASSPPLHLAHSGACSYFLGQVARLLHFFSRLPYFSVLIARIVTLSRIVFFLRTVEELAANPAQKSDLGKACSKSVTQANRLTAGTAIIRPL